jgi:hypothetical protein
MEASIRTSDFEHIGDILYACLRQQDQTPANRARVDTLMRGIAQCPFVVPDENGYAHLFWKGGNGYGGNPSGNYLTSLVNCLFSTFLIVFSYLCECADRHREPDINMFWKTHRAVIMGDDICLSCSPEREEWYRSTGRSPAQALSTHAYEIGVVLESTGWDGVEFTQSVFCGMQTVIIDDTYYGVNYTFQLREDRQWCALVQGGTRSLGSDYCLNLQRLGAMYNNNWCNVKARKEINLVYNRYVSDMTEGCTYDGTYEPPNPVVHTADWALARSARLSEDALRHLYLGLYMPTKVVPRDL